MQDKEISNIIVDAIQDKKGIEIVILDLEKIEGSSTGKYFICTGKNPSQVSAIADNIRDMLLEKAHRKPYNYDGYRNSQWIVLDYGDFMVHIFLPDMRQHYALENLWSDAPATFIDDID